MNRSIAFTFFLISCFLLHCNKQPVERLKSHPSGEEISLTWKLIANNYQNRGVYKSILSLTNNSDQILSNKDWELYFNHTMARKIIQDSLPSEIKVVHINGDLYKILPTEKFPALSKGDHFDIPLITNYVAIKYSDAPGGFYFVFKDSEGRETEPEAVEEYQIIPFDNDMITRGSNDHIPVTTAATQYQENLSLRFIPAKNLPLIIPTPLSIRLLGDSLALNPTYKIHYQKGLEQEASYLSELLKGLLKENITYSESNTTGDKIISLQSKSLYFSSSNEAYYLTIKKNNGIVIAAHDRAGIFYGIQSLRALMPLKVYTQKSSTVLLPELAVEDSPAFPFRGIMIDVARNFQSKESILKLIDLFSFYKINKLTLHLADDEGWRLDIEELPELTEVASKRGHTLTEEDHLIPSYGSGPFGNKTLSNGFYSREDFKEILMHAKSRHIEVIPELDLPGHARAAIKAMDVRYERLLTKGDTAEAKKYLLRDLKDQSEYSSVQMFNDNVVCPCEKGVYNFLKTVAQDVKEMYQESDAVLTSINIAGDEVPNGVWVKSPACEKFMSENNNINNVDDLKTYFFKRCIEILQSEDLITSGFEDIGIHRVKNEKGESVIEIREDLPKKDVRLVAWSNVTGWGNEDFAYRLANAGFPVVMGHVTNLYFDLAYTNSPDDPGQYWGGFNDTKKAFEYLPYNVYYSAFYDIDGNAIDPKVFNDKVKLTEKGKSNIIGLQGHLWSETLKYPGMVEYFLFPKMVGMAERAWAKQPAWALMADRDKRMKMLNEEWNVFANAIGQKELPRLDYLAGGVNYYLPIPGAIIENDTLKANSSFPGLTIRYTMDGSDPTKSSPVYSKPEKAKGTIKLSAFTSNGRSGRIVILNSSDK